MGHMKAWWILGFEWWGKLRPAEMITAGGRRFVPLFWGLWLRQPFMGYHMTGTAKGNEVG